MSDKLEQKFQKKGLKLTDQRRTIARVILESKEAYGESDHPDVDELYNRVSKIDSKISIATIYRTVKLFEEAGILTKHDFKGGKARYELNDDHNHLIDIKTGEIIEFVDDEINQLQEKIAEKYGYKLVDHRLELYGVKKNHNKMSQKIFIKTFGCQMNEYDSKRIYDVVKEIGFEKTDQYKEADCYLLNTCHIRDKASEKVYHEIGRVKKIFRSKKKPLVIVAGCVAQAENQEMLKREPYIDIIIGPQAYHKINDTILNFTEKLKVEETEFDAVSKFEYLSRIQNKVGKATSFLTIQEGCDKFCHFCVVPYTRGPEYSRPFDQIINEAKSLADQGSKEIILLGQNVNAYNDNDKRLSNIIGEIEKIKNVQRIRFTTSHPKDMTDDLIEIYKDSKKLMPLIHLPVQSGSDKILNLMNRKHTVEEYLKTYERLKKINRLVEFSSDFIIAYPGEEEKDFLDTLSLIKEVKFINSYSFIFSPRPGTIAEASQTIDKKISLKRLEKVQETLLNNQIEKNKSLENKTIEVLTENQTEDKTKIFGRSEYMTPVIFDGNKKDVGKILKIKIIKSNRNTLFGKMVDNLDQKVA